MPRMRLAPVASLLALALGGCRAKPLEFAPEVGIPQIVQGPVRSVASLKELRGSAVVLEFWATWCRPCRETLPHMNGLVSKFEGKPVKFIAVSNEDPETVAEFLKEFPMKAWVGLDRSREVSEAFRVTGIPHVVLIDPFGRVQLRITTSFFYASDIEKALKAKPPKS
ncbi:MAG: TlpA family protein disulfide reductase [Elusimicrobia bacterium]|nr:TlpA family protein disulfide reductase [Elusimicrobiota bacterium]